MLTQRRYKSWVVTSNPWGDPESEDYRMRYGVYRTDVDLQLLHQRHPFVCAAITN